MKKRSRGLFHRFNSIKLVWRWAIAGSVSALGIVIVTVLAISPTGISQQPLAQQIAQNISQALGGETPTPAVSAANPNGASVSSDGGQSANERDSNGRFLCDENSHTATPEEVAACTKGYIAPRVKFASAKCTPTDIAGEYSITVTWKTIGGNFSRGHVQSRFSSGGMREVWTVTEVTADSVVLDARVVRVAFDSMNGDPGTIDSVKSSPSPTYTAAELCGLGVVESTAEPTPEPTE